jgi:UPF0716 family protein affecting phage T7 exclusion
MSYFEEVTSVFRKAFKAAVRDISNGKYMTINVVTIAMPAFFVVILLLLLCIPVETERMHRRRVRSENEKIRKARKEKEAVDAASPDNSDKTD